jgi:hypothetical protein
MLLLLVGIGSGRNTTRITLDQATDTPLVHNSRNLKPPEISNNKQRTRATLLGMRTRAAPPASWIIWTLSAAADPYNGPIARRWHLI